MVTTIQKELADVQRASLREKMAAVLESKGLSPIQPNGPRPVSSNCDPDCPECYGNGFVRINPDAELKDKDYGKIATCSRLHIKRIQQMDTTQFGIERDELSLDWNVVKFKIGDTHLQGMKAVKAVQPAFERGHGMVALLGSFGHGKTLVGKILIARALSSGRRAVYVNMSRILLDIQAAFDEKDHMAKALIGKLDYWNSLDVLFIDELDKANETSWARSIMFEVLDRRYTRAIREEALTVIASNKKDDQLDGYLVDRLKDNRLGPVVYLDGPSARSLMPEGYRY